ncbi:MULTISPECIES: hypothetical protein [unclassified Amycolatopsis]|uniref:hypothetical protein n=1 Tax=unclassified Amycolatopsis TaxID=2618356 RepID=UPI0028764685|nr:MULTISPECIES: hypothetical protein [unclassified Amycolatopsis]MDS0140071.1 hypothetical protein [Amycolatopsis sp. 505]MDS0146910.1 hypothetical protein [Amycolatopsis sp. CM201R]
MPDKIARSAVADGFAELVLADPAWVRAEFDAIVAANFEPPSPPVPAARRRRGVPRPPRVAGLPRRRPGVRLLAAKCPRRERSPPRRRTAKGTDTRRGE